MKIKDHLPAIGAWLVNGDTGVSSMTMLAIALGATEGDFDAPYDNGDFKRCSELVKAVPSVRDAFPLIGEKVPTFGPILAHWDELCALLDQNLQGELYQRLKELRGRP